MRGMPRVSPRLKKLKGLFLLLVELFLLFGSDCMCWNHCIMLITLTLTLNINWNIDSVGAMSSNQCFLGKFDGTWIITWSVHSSCMYVAMNSRLTTLPRPPYHQDLLRHRSDFARWILTKHTKSQNQNDTQWATRELASNHLISTLSIVINFTHGLFGSFNNE